MKARTILGSLVALFTVVAVSSAAAPAANPAPNMGTWKLNEAKSKITPGSGKNTLVVYSADAGKIKVTVDGVDKDGKPLHNEWLGMFDGQDYKIVGDPLLETRGYKQIDPNTVELWNKAGGKVMVTGKIVTAPDGKSRTVTTTRKDASGKEITDIYWYDKQP
jgi:hypothetical protein